MIPLTDKVEPAGDLIEILRQAHGLDIACYSESLLSWSLERRWQGVAGMTCAGYLQHLGRNRGEAESFVESLSIHHSEFFRDPLAFAMLEHRLLPALAKAKEASAYPEIRVWSAGCAAGEEAYSVSILLSELCNHFEIPVRFRLFATDNSAQQIELACAGSYSLMHDISRRDDDGFRQIAIMQGSYLGPAEEMQGREDAALIAKAMLSEEGAPGFCRELLKALLAHTDSQVGAVYLLNEAKSEFVHCSSIGLDTLARTAFPAAELGGELGAAVATRQIKRITDIPADTRFTFTAVSGGMVPREIVTIPVVSGDDVSALVSLASVHAYSEAAMQLVHDVWGVLTARMNGVLAFQRIRDLAGRLEAQNRELDQQKRELSSQTSELCEQNAELEMQKREIGEANRQKSQLLSNMSHELRTPLNSVIALSSVLHRRLAGKIPAEEFGFLEVIERNGKNLLEFINDILDLSRIEAGRVDLVVEGNLDNLRTMKALLESHYHVVVGHDGQDAIVQARRHGPDIVLMDIALPEVAGIAALAEIRRDETLRDIAVFAVTASAMTGDRERILAYGFDGYIAKTIERGLLMETLRGAFDA